MSERPSHPVIAALLDVVMRPVRPLRARVVPRAAGDVLEVGLGTGGNLPYYERSALRSLVGCEPDPHMRRRAERRWAGHLPDLPARVDDAPAEALPYPDRSFDDVVLTFVLCTVADPEAALAEAHRVLRPGGRLLFVEHVAHDHATPRRVQDALDTPWSRVSGGCHLNRDTISAIERAGFREVLHQTHGDPRWTLAPVKSGVARK